MPFIMAVPSISETQIFVEWMDVQKEKFYNKTVQNRLITQDFLLLKFMFKVRNKKCQKFQNYKIKIFFFTNVNLSMPFTSAEIS